MTIDTDIDALYAAIDTVAPMRWHDRERAVHCKANVTPYTYVEERGALAAIATYPECRALMLVWPPYDLPMAREALRAFRGDRVIYIGEWGGCTADAKFHTMLKKRWTLTERVAIRQWPGVHDTVHLYER